MVRVIIVVLLIEACMSAQAPNTHQPPSPSTASASAAFSDVEGAAVLRTFADALEAHSLNRFLATFDPNSYPRFPVFAGEMDSYFGRYEQFRVHFLLKQTVSESNGRGVMLAQMELEALPIGTEATVRHNAELRFELVETGGKWRIAGFTPREFLS